MGVVSTSELREIVAQLREKGERIVFTNGRFDLVHVGHVRYLQRAKSFGTVLIVGINSDAAVRKISDPGRPINPAEYRMEVIAALKPVDYVVEFDEPTANSLLELIRPDVYVKGGDYRSKPLPEAETARRVGARLELVDLEAGQSTTGIIERIVSRYGR
ncbi:MAG: adenylyltransferase/cytidyltransferase family protein [Firmicutes bacterium]|nr:adenylyltransferase/cytidyltransferase family protein [Bacillota bacterium]